MLNKVVLMGRLTKDPELRYTQTNTECVNFSIAVERTYSRQGEERQADFINVVAWKKTAEFISKWFAKGQMIVVVGSLQSNSWQDKNGNNRTSINVVANEVYFGESKRSQEGANAGNGGNFQQAQSNYNQNPQGSQGWSGRNAPMNNQEQFQSGNGNAMPPQQRPQGSQGWGSRNAPMNSQEQFQFGNGNAMPSQQRQQTQPSNQYSQRQMSGNSFDLPNTPVQPSYDAPKNYSDFADFAGDDEVPF